MPVLGRLAHVLGVVAHGEQPAVELRVQRLDAAVHDLREAREVVDRAHVEARVLERARRAAGRDELDAELGQAAREVDDAALVGHRQQRTPDANRPRLRERLLHAIGGGVGDATREYPREAPRLRRPPRDAAG